MCRDALCPLISSAEETLRGKDRWGQRVSDGVWASSSRISKGRHLCVCTCISDSQDPGLLPTLRLFLAHEPLLQRVEGAGSYWGARAAGEGGGGAGRACAALRLCLLVVRVPGAQPAPSAPKLCGAARADTFLGPGPLCVKGQQGRLVSALTSPLPGLSLRVSLGSEGLGAPLLLMLPVLILPRLNVC